MADFTAAEIETGSGKSTALVYESVADIAAPAGFLDLRGYGSLAGGEEATQKSAMLRATTLVEAALRPYFNGRSLPRNSDQLRLEPRLGQYDAQGLLLAEDEVPAAFLDGWRLACEKLHAGRLCLPSPGLADMESLQVSASPPGESSGSKSVSVQRRPGPAPDPIRSEHEIWALLRPILPP